MNVITSTFAVSLFPRTTFIDRIAYTCGRNVTTMRVGWLPTSESEHVSYSRGRRLELPRTISSQRRRIADQSSWIVPFYGPDAFIGHESLQEAHIVGVRFDILDWTDVLLGGAFCLSITEPFMFE